jgi:hypothetical protein
LAESIAEDADSSRGRPPVARRAAMKRHAIETELSKRQRSPPLGRRVQVAKPTATPRFNMPFELGLTVAWQKAQPKRHTWCVFESKPHRVERSLSDLSGTDVYIHHGRPFGVFSELANAFVRSRQQPSVDQMKAVFHGLREGLPKLMRNANPTAAPDIRRQVG